MPDPWHDVPFPPPQREPQSYFNWPAFGCVLCAIAAACLVLEMISVGERMVDAVLAIQWPV